jgi:hypothetical protein
VDTEHVCTVIYDFVVLRVEDHMVDYASLYKFASLRRECSVAKGDAGLLRFRSQADAH